MKLLKKSVAVLLAFSMTLGMISTSFASDRFMSNGQYIIDEALDVLFAAININGILLQNGTPVPRPYWEYEIMDGQTGMIAISDALGVLLAAIGATNPARRTCGNCGARPGINQVSGSPGNWVMGCCGATNPPNPTPVTQPTTAGPIIPPPTGPIATTAPVAPGTPNTNNNTQGPSVAPPGQPNSPLTGPCGWCGQTKELCQGGCSYCHECDFSWFGVTICGNCKWGGDCLAMAGVRWCGTHFSCAACCGCGGSSNQAAPGMPNGTCTRCGQNKPICPTSGGCGWCADCNFSQYGMVNCTACHRCSNCVSVSYGSWTPGNNRCGFCQ